MRLIIGIGRDRAGRGRHVVIVNQTLQVLDDHRIQAKLGQHLHVTEVEQTDTRDELMIDDVASKVGIAPDELLLDSLQHLVGSVAAAGLIAGSGYLRRSSTRRPGSRTGSERNAFLSSCVYIVATLAGAAVGLYPALLPSSAGPANSITISNAAAGDASLSIGLIWWSIGMAVALGYTVVVSQ